MDSLGKSLHEGFSRLDLPVGLLVRVVLITLIDKEKHSPLWVVPSHRQGILDWMCGEGVEHKVNMHALIFLCPN